MFKFAKLFRCLNVTNKSFFSSTRKFDRNRIVVWVSATFFTGLIGATYFYKKKKFKEIEEKIETNKKDYSLQVYVPVEGGFNLIDTNGNPVSLNSYKGKWLLVYFGFCNCPDICPEQIEKMVLIVERLERTKGVDPLQVLFISVDPERDNPTVLKEYLKEYSDKLVGLTGTTQSIKEVTKNYRIYFSKGPVDQFGDYIVDHAIIMYLLGPDGEFVDFYGQNKTIPEICKGIQAHMKKHSLQSV